MSTVALTVTPGAVVTAESTLDPALLNRIATPKVELLPGAGIGPEHLRLSEIADQFAPAVRGYSWLPVGAMWPLEFATPGGLNCPAAAYTYNAKDIWVSPAGATVVSSRTAEGPPNGIPWSLTVVGASGATTCEIGTYSNADHTGPLIGKNLIVSAYIYNGTGGPFTPQLIVRTSDALNDEDAVTVRVGPVNAVDGPIPNAAWTRAYWRLTATDLVNLANGAEIVIRIPSGSLSANTKLVRIAQWQGEIGDTTPTSFILLQPPLPVPNPLDGLPTKTLDPADALLVLANTPTGRGWVLVDAGLVRRILGSPLEFARASIFSQYVPGTAGSGTLNHTFDGGKTRAGRTALIKAKIIIGTSGVTGSSTATVIGNAITVCTVSLTSPDDVDSDADFEYITLDVDGKIEFAMNYTNCGDVSFFVSIVGYLN